MMPENLNSEKVGIAIYGRNPGFTIFYKRNWNGEDPSDVKFHELVDDNSPIYYTVQLGEKFDVYEFALCKYISGTRNDSFRIAMQVPANKVIINSDGNQVSPKFPLDQIAKAVVDKCLERLGQTYRIPENVIRPDFNIPEIEQILATFRLVTRWGRPVVMNPAGPYVFVNIDDSMIGPTMKAATSMTQFAAASRLVLGHFKENALAATESVTQTVNDNEVLAPVVVEAKIRDSKGIQHTAILESAPVELHSSQFGYDVRCYDDVAVALTAQNVLNAVYGKQPLPSNPRVTIVPSPENGCVFISFSPQAIVKDYKVIVKEIRNKNVNPDDILAHIILDFKGSMKGMRSGEFALTGPEILEFEGLAGRLGEFKDNFSLTNNDYILKNVRLNGQELIVQVEEKEKPKPVVPDPQNPVTVPNPEYEWVKVRIVIPGGPIEVLPVLCYQCDNSFNKIVSRRMRLEFKTSTRNENADNAAADENAKHGQPKPKHEKNRKPQNRPAENPETDFVMRREAECMVPRMKGYDIVVEVGAPALYTGKCVNYLEKGYVAQLINKSDKQGAFNRYMSSMRLVDSTWFETSYKVWRWISSILIILLIFILGAATAALVQYKFGILPSENTETQITLQTTENMSGTVEDEGQKDDDDNPEFVSEEDAGEKKTEQELQEQAANEDSDLSGESDAGDETEGGES